MNDKRNVTINILPQSPDAWGWIACAVIIFSIASCAAKIDGPNNVEVERIRANAEIEKAKILAGAEK